GPDTTTMHWASDLPDPFTHTKKDFSVLSGTGIMSQLVWNSAIRYFVTGTDSCTTSRVWLRNIGTAGINIDSVSLSDNSQFKITSALEMPLDRAFPLQAGDS